MISSACSISTVEVYMKLLIRRRIINSIHNSNRVAKCMLKALAVRFAQIYLYHMHLKTCIYVYVNGLNCITNYIHIYYRGIVYMCVYNKNDDKIYFVKKSLHR